MTYKSYNYDQTTTTDWYTLSGAHSVTSQVSLVDRGFTSGVTLPGYFRRKRGGELLPYTYFEQAVQRGGIQSSVYKAYRASPAQHAYATGKFTRNQDSGWIINETGMIATAKTYSCDTCLQEAASRIYAQGHDSLTFMAEYHKTHRMVRDGLKNLRRFLDTARRLRVRNLTEFWLEYRYGWRVLAYDIQNIADAFESLKVKRDRFTERSGFTTTWPVNTSSTTSTADGILTVKWNQIHRLSRRGSITADITPSVFRMNPAITAWELVRFSFVIDWFIDVGRALETASFMATVNNYAASSGWNYQIDSQYSYDLALISPPGPAGISGNWNIACESNAEVSVRLPSTVKIKPLLDVNLDVGKGLDILSLVNEFFDPKHGFNRLRV